MLDLLGLAVLVATVVLLRKVPRSPAPLSLTSRQQRAGRVLAVTGAVAIVLQLLLFTTDEGAFVFFLLFGVLTFPTLAATVGAVVTGRRISRATATSRFPAVLSGVLMTLAATYWTCFLLQTETNGAWYLRSEVGIDVLAVVVAALGAGSVVGTCTMLSRPQGMRLSWTTWATVVGSCLIAVLVADLTVLGSRVEVHLEGEQDCSAIESQATEKVSDIPTGAPALPLPKGYQVVGAFRLSPTLTGDAVPIGTVVIAGSEPELVVVLKAKKRGKSLPKDARAAIEAAGLTPVNEGRAETNGELSSYSLGYQGASDGTIRLETCDGGQVVLVTQVIKTEATGACAAAVAGCTELKRLTAPGVSLVQTLFRVDGAPHALPVLTVTDGKPTLDITSRTSMPEFAFFDYPDLDAGLRKLGWRTGPTRCSRGACFGDGADTDLVRATWTRGALAAVLTVVRTPDGRSAVVTFRAS